MSDMFYRAFEERHRGSFELIQSRLNVYLPFILPLKKFHTDPKALDLGCGRGEWLDLLQKNGFKAKGVDLDEGMLQSCRERNLDTSHGDAIEYLKNLDSESMNLISAFHFVEHIPFTTIRELAHEAHRVLTPGGLLILETPNSENLLVGTSSFYLDPTHHQPIPSELLSFIVEYEAFKRVKSIFLQEQHNLSTIQELGLQHILEGVSCDYAIVSQKNADPSLLSAFTKPFEREYGNRLIPLAKSYDEQIQNLKRNVIELQKQHASPTERLIDDQNFEKIRTGHNIMTNHNLYLNEMARSTNNHQDLSLVIAQQQIEKLQSELDISNNQYNQLRSHTLWLQNELDFAQTQIQTLNQKAHEWWSTADNLNKELESYLIKSIKRKLSPIKKIILQHKLASILKRIREHQPKQLMKEAIKLALKKPIKLILSNNRIKSSLILMLNRYPQLKQRLRNFAIKHRIMNIPGYTSQRSKFNTIVTQFDKISESHEKDQLNVDLSPRSSQIYSALKDAIQKRESVNENNH